MISKLFAVAVVGILATSVTPGAKADVPGVHPGYLHAMSDLREASSLIAKRGGSPDAHRFEDAANFEITAAIRELKSASIDDGKKIDGDHFSSDLGSDYDGIIHRADDLLHKAKEDISGEEDDQRVLGLRQRADNHIEEAIRQTEEAMYELRRKHG